MSKRGQLHQLLAVEADLTGKANRLLEEARGTFNKGEHFTGGTRALKMFDEARAGEETVEVHIVDTTVSEKLAYLHGPICDSLDAFLQKEATNQGARSDVVIDDITLLGDVPATGLLGLETRLKNIRSTYESIPTLQPGIDWATSDEANIFEDRNPTERMRTEKTFKPVILHEATDKHPAQIEKIAIDEAVGKYRDIRLSGMISSADKSVLLGRIDKLITAVKSARMAANCTEVVDARCGEKLLDFIHNGG